MTARAALVALVIAFGGQQVQPRPVQKLYDENGDAKARIAAAIKAADVDDVRAVIIWGANDDDGAARFETALRAPEVTKTRWASDEYMIARVDVGHLDKNLDLAKTYGMTLKSGALPAMTVLDEHGNVIARATAADFVDAEKPSAFDSKKIAAFFVAHQAPAPDAIAPFEAGLKQAKGEQKLLFVWWSAPW